MNSVELDIADALREEHGMDVQVRLVDDGEVEFINSLGYAAPFVHRSSVDGEDNQFIIERNSHRTSTVEVEVPRENPLKHDRMSSLVLEKLFAQYCFGEVVFNSVSSLHSLLLPHTATELFDLTCISCPAQPPEASSVV